MTNYSDLLYLIGAMAIYALMLVNVNAMIFKNQHTMTTSEVEYGAISVAQEVMNKVQLMNYNAFNSSNAETTETELEKIENSDWYEVNAEIYSYSSSQRKVEVKVTSPFMDDAVRTTFIKTDY